MPLLLIIRHDKDDAEYRTLGKKYGKPVCALIGEATLIHSRWLISAAHAAQHITSESATFLDDEYSISKIVFHPGWQMYRGIGSIRHHLPFRWFTDLALICLERPVLNIEPVAIYQWSDEIGKVATFVGRGKTGTGLTGNVHSDGQIRGATNVISNVSKRWLAFQFDEPPNATPLEGISGDGDSGGPAFIERDGLSFLAGVSSWQDHHGPEGYYGAKEFYVRISSYTKWINKIVNNQKIMKGNV